ncbi:hypothetical protein ACFQQB_05255 [Nonomuraea rubra]|uniref:hypothetical protein n=1 Tax=Nonomuraea rubra TaxID=46180 RepID=UPI00360D3BC8
MAPSGPQQPPFGAPTGPRVGRRGADDLDDPSGPHPQPILPLTTDSRNSSATPWPLASPDDLREQSRDLSHDVSRSRLASLPGGARGPARAGAGWRTTKAARGSATAGPRRSRSSAPWWPWPSWRAPCGSS